MIWSHQVKHLAHFLTQFEKPTGQIFAPYLKMTTVSWLVQDNTFMHGLSKTMSNIPWIKNRFRKVETLPTVIEYMSTL